MSYKIIEIDEDELRTFDGTIIQVLNSEKVFKELPYLSGYISGYKEVWKLTCLIKDENRNYKKY